MRSESEKQRKYADYDVQEDDTPDTRLLAIQKWRVCTLFIFDISNNYWDPTLGHLAEQNKLPVVVAHLSRRKVAYKPHPGTRERINKDVAFFHDANGFGGTPPFIEDHTLESPPVYSNSRSLVNSGP
ncbi:unnamed protein product [Penicillium roqueforti FM164]|uniref:Genomic scaffold, ProqFM164S01 n=1 Tax=Penicillium roqueforti (strain FM164) TaxID=1365484 RepID=W6Q042_PENRF|nr:unnamed protein product [Penicillium roqueforti FM164]